MKSSKQKTLKEEPLREATISRNCPHRFDLTGFSVILVHEELSQ